MSYSKVEVSYDDIENFAKQIKTVVNGPLLIGIIFGSSLKGLANSFTATYKIDYKDIKDFPLPNGRLLIGYLFDQQVIVMQGRAYFHEGNSLALCSLPVRVLNALGVKYLFITSSGGALNPEYKTGDIMIIRDHINLMGIPGISPLIGLNDERFGPRFVPMTDAYHKKLIEFGKTVAMELRIADKVHEGVYACVAGPNFETVAEARMLKSWGADLVGMSTVHEVITARQCGMNVFAFSLVTVESPLTYKSAAETKREYLPKDQETEVEIRCISFINSVIGKFVQSMKYEF